MGSTRRWSMLCVIAALFVSCASSKKLFFQTHRPDNMDDEGHFVFNIEDPPAQKIMNKILGKEAKTPSFIPADQNLEDSDFESIENLFDPNEDTEKDFGEKSRRKRQAPAPTTAVPVLKSPLSQNVTKWVMNDTLRQMIIHWAGKGSHAIVVLTKDVGVEEVATRSNVYFSHDYGQSFEIKPMITGTISKFYHTPSDIDSYIFVDIKAKTLYTTQDMGKHFATTKCPFEPTFLSTHPVHTTHIIGYDKKASKKVLYVSKDYGHTWLKIQEDIKAAHWGYSSTNDFDNPNTLYVERLELSGRVSILKTETYFQDDDSENVLVTNVEDFAIRNNSLFATRPGQNGDNDLLLTVSRSPPFVVANIPTKVAKKEFFIIDAADQQIMILVSHGFGRTDLYISEQNKIDYTFSLANVTYFNPEGIGSSQTALVNRDDRFADIHKVKGLRTIFLANTATTLKSGQYNMTSMKSQITFDKGVIWEDVPPPRTDSTGAPICNTSRCSLHIMQEFHHAHITSMSSLVMSEASAPGYILASGNVGDRIKNHIDLFFSPNGGKDWREIRKGEWFYTWADHGGIIAIVKKYGKSKDLLYTLNEGQTWHNITFYNEPINVYGLMTEPGETTTIFTVFGATNQATNSWVIIQVDLMGKFRRRCSSWQYRDWSPEDENGVSCLLGAKYVYSRKSMYNTEYCYNGNTFDRPTSIKSCPCTRFDFECDRGFYLLPNSHSLACKLDSNSNVDPYEIPPNCRSGTTYKRTKGYRRVPADICEGGDADKAYGPIDTQCPVIEEDAFLLITSSAGISRIDLETDKLENLPVNVGYAEIHSIDFDYKTNCIYYTQNNNIERICLDGSSTANKTIVHEDQRISAMAFDWDSRNMYWAIQSTPPAMKVMNIDSTQRYVRKLAINSSLLHEAKSIAVYSRKGYLYYTDLGTYYSGSKIIRAKMDGTNATVLTHDYSSRWYSSLQIDEGSNRLFFISKSSYFSKVGSMDLDGDHFQQAVTYDSQARYVTTFKEYAYYWREPGDIQRADKYGYTSNYTVAFNILNMGAMKAIRRGLQAYPNKCGNNTSKCPQLCIPMPVEGKTKDAVDQCYCDNVNYVTSGKTCGCRAGEILTGSGQCEPNKTSCNSNEFRCRNGRCIPFSWKCDRGNDCSDGSDEVGCAYASCKPNFHRCGNSDYCINNDWVCDGETDCADGSDEANCNTKTCNATLQFTCKSGQCINKYFKCDGNYDCSDLSDEENCFTTPSTCTDDQIMCETTLFGNRCIPSSWKCDGENDCTDGFDEKGCDATSSCSSYQFDCGNGICVLAYWRCDGENDCSNGADEKNCTATTSRPTTSTTLPFDTGTCGLTEMLCQNHGVCIPLEWKCDGTNDCGDHSDEFGCTASTNHSLIGPHHCFSSALQYKCDNGLCILSFFECDGDNDCGDWSDEEHCPGFYEHGNHPGCFNGNGFDYSGSRNYTKSGKTCQKWSRNTPHRPHYWPQNRDHNFCRNPDNDGYGPWCYTTDPNKRWEYCGIPHCANNGSSPVYPVPTREPNSCHDGYYSCGDDKCIPDRWVCDGDYDCDNHADEDWCNFTCNAAAEMMCHNKRCVPKSSKCDGINDCLDNTDEENCASSTTPTCNSTTDFTCMDDNHCIPMSSHCNGVFDCRDHSDEYNCTSGGGMTTSPSWTIACTEGFKYIGHNDLCNYVPDCPEGTDESRCPKHVIPGVSLKKCTDDDTGACETIQWSAPTAPIPPQYASVMKYMIYYGSQVDSEQFEDIKKLNARHAKITESSVNLRGLEWNTQYFVYITMSFNGTILPLQRDSKSRFDTGLGKPGVPTNVEVRQDLKDGENTFASIVTWNAPTKNQRGIKFYYVKSTYIDNAKSNVERVSYQYYELCTHCTYTLYLHTGVLNVSVLASNNVYNSSWSKPFTLSVAKLHKPILELGAVKGYTCEISWTIPTDQAPSDFAGFRVRIASNELGARYMNIQNSSARKTTVTKLQPQTPYRLSVSYLNRAGIEGLYSDDHQIMITDSSLQPVFPKIVKTSSNSTTSIAVILAPAPKSKDIMYEVSWNVRLERDDAKVKKVNGTSVVITNLPVNIQQILQVRVIEPYIGKYSEEIRAKPRYDFSEAPRNVYVKVNKDHVSGYINFDRPTDSYQESLGYLLSISETDTKKPFLTHAFKNTMNATMHYDFRNLVPGTTYTAFVRVNAKGTVASNHTFVDGVVEGPTILSVIQIGHSTDRYQVLVHVKDEFKSFYKSSSVTGIQAYKCEGVDVVCATNNAQCTALKDQPANVEKFEVSGMKKGHNYTLCVRAHCRAEHECAFYSYSVPLGSNGGIISPVTAPSFALTPVHIAAVVAPVLALVLILVGVIAYLQIRKKRLADAYRGFVASHYDPQSGEAIFVSNNDDDDNGFALDDENDAETPLITGFADDEPLIVA